MRRARRFVGRLDALVRPGRAERELEREIEAHLQMLEEEYRRRGMNPEEARRAARRAMGGVEQAKELHREERTFHWLDRLRQDMIAIRMLRKRPGFCLVVILTLGLGIGAVTAVFALVNRILIQPLPYDNADRLVTVKHAAPGLGLSETGLSSGTYFHYRAHSRTLETLAIYRETTMDLAGRNDAAEQVDVALVSPELFEVLGVEAALGRLFTEHDAAPGFMDLRWPVPVLLGHGLWQRRYGGDPSIVGQFIYTTNSTPRHVIGVLPPGFAFPRPETDIWRLFVPPAVTANFARGLDLQAVARLRSGVTPAVAAAELEALIPMMQGVYADATPKRLREVRLTPIVVPLKEAVVGDAGRMLWAQLGAMAFLLLVVCANVANLFLVRADDRAHEIAIRRALGAQRTDLMRLFLGESLILSAAGAVLGFLLAGWALSALVAFAPVELPRLHEVRLDGWTLGFTTGVAVLAALVFTALSVLERSPTGLLPALKTGGSGTSPSRERRRAERYLVGVQIAFALVLVVGSTLILQSFWRLMRVDPGFNPESVLTVQIGIPGRRAPREHKQIYDGLLERVQALPGVERAAAVNAVPLAGGEYVYPLRRAEPAARTGDSELPVALKFFTRGYFQTMETPVVEGAGLEPGQRPAFPNPVVVSGPLARRLFPGESPIGKEVYRLELDGRAVEIRGLAVPPYTIAGVVGEVREESLRSGPAEIVYIPILEPSVERQIVPTNMTLVLRTNLPPLALAGTVRDLIAGFDSTITVARVRTLDAIVSGSTAMEGFLAVLLLLATAGSLFLAAVGIYGVVAYTVRRRTTEISIRVAMGAEPSQVLRMVLYESLGIVLAGVALGLTAAAGATRTLDSLLFQMSATDPATMVAATALVVATAFVAILVPARRAARVDPMMAIRNE